MTKMHSPVGEIIFTETIDEKYQDILTDDCQKFIYELSKHFSDRLIGLLTARQEEAARLRKGGNLKFPPETEAIRQADWCIASIPEDLLDRRVEITGPAERKMMINALNSGAKIFMADLEDSLSPNWHNVLQAHINLRDAVHRTLDYTTEDGKEYRLKDEGLAVLIVRPRGLHLHERHATIAGQAIPAALFDFGVYFYHNAQQLIRNGSGPYVYLPKLEHYKEARWWNDVFAFAENYLGLPTGTIKATVLIETINAAFQMDEILFELSDYIVAQNAGRWDYIFSYIKQHAHSPDFLCPDRTQITMEQPFLRAYSRLLIQTCHRRGALAMGGMSAFIPIKDDELANDKALTMVRQDKLREVFDGHDGTWVAHPGLIDVAYDVFNEHMPQNNQRERSLDEHHITEADLLEVPHGTITEAGVRNNIHVGIRYLVAWLSGQACVPIFNLMEDAATAEIARTQLWQWLHYGAELEDGRVFTASLYEELKQDELQKMQDQMGKYELYQARLDDAITLFDQLVYNTELEDFLTTKSYYMI